MHELIHGQWKAEVVRALVRLDVPDLLGTETRSVVDLAAEAQVDADRLQRLLVLAVALGLFTQCDESRFRNNTASFLLSADHPHSIRTEVCHALSTWTRIAWDNLDHAVRQGASGFELATGTGVFPFLEARPEDAADFHAFQAQVTRRNAAALLSRHTFPAGATVVDVGGGNGTLLAEVLRRQPSLRGVLFDRPVTIDAARATGPRDLADRMTLVAGDLFEAVPPGHQVYVLSHVLHDWPGHRAVQILQRVVEAMKPDSYLLVLENIKADPVSLLVAYLDVLMLTAWGSRERTLDEYQALFNEAGLSLVGYDLIEPRSQLALLTARTS